MRLVPHEIRAHAHIHAEAILLKARAPPPPAPPPPPPPTPPSLSCASLEPAVRLRVEATLEAEEAPGRRAIEQARSELEGAQRSAADAEENANRAQAELSQAARTLPPQPALPPSPARHLSHPQ